jgi:hypothetical protein
MKMVAQGAKAPSTLCQGRQSLQKFIDFQCVAEGAPCATGRISKDWGRLAYSTMWLIIDESRLLPGNA